MGLPTEENINEQPTLLESYLESKTELGNECADKVNLPFEVKEGEEYFVEELGKIKKKPFFSLVKRLFDFLVSFICIVVCLLPFIIISLAIVCSSRGGAFYAQERLGLNGKKFKVIKFRTMVFDAEKGGAQWSEGDADERITKVGRILRNTHLDELPQLFCCLIGTMSLVGPRPERECFYLEFEKYIHGFNQRLKVKPGLTGLAQVNGGYDLKPQEKIVYDIEYIKKRSLWLDIKIMFKTVAVVLLKKGVK